MYDARSFGDGNDGDDTCDVNGEDDVASVAMMEFIMVVGADNEGAEVVAVIAIISMVMAKMRVPVMNNNSKTVPRFRR